MTVKLSEVIKAGGRGVIATSDSKGVVNTAIYAQPHIIDNETLAWGMTEGRSFHNISENPYAAYLYMNPGAGFSGVRIGLKRKEIEKTGDMLDLVRKNTAEKVSPEAASAVKYVVYFTVTEVRPLI
ncbi:MAG TPA: pyridoxamine 5'-phosphate oxidase family protein [Thermodesulfovibrionales bacterium]|nr:pyridoxamine 5'-phosphate oxidase family protein [Thermodesulfovibrionales bacterium]